MDAVDLSALEAIGTITAGGGGIVGIYLLVRAVYKMWTGQIEEQRKLLGEARASRTSVVEDVERLRQELREVQAWCDDTQRQLQEVINSLREEIQLLHVKKRQWAEYASELRGFALMSGMKREDLPTFPQSNDSRVTTGTMPVEPPHTTDQ